MVDVFACVKEGMYLNPGVTRSGNTKVRKNNIEFLKNSILELAMAYGAKILHYDWRLSAPEGFFTREGEISPFDINLQEGDYVRFVTVTQNGVTKRYVVVFVQKDDFSNVDMLEKFFYTFP